MWQPPWGCYSIPDAHQIPILVTFLVNLKRHFMGVATTLMSNLWDTIIHKVFHSGLLRTSIVASFKFDYAFGKLYRKSYSHSPCFNSTSRSSPMPFPPGAPMLPTNLPVHGPPMLHQSVGSLHPGSCPGPHGMVAHQSHTSPGLCHQPCEPPPIHSSAPPIVESTSKLWKTDLMQHLLGSWKLWLKRSKHHGRSHSKVHLVILFWHRALQSLWYPHLLYLLRWHLQPWTNLNKLVLGRPLFLILPSYQSPLPPKLAQSAQDFTATSRRRRSRSPQDALPSRRSRTRHRPIYRSRSHSHRLWREGFRAQAFPHSYISSQGLPSRTSRPPPSSTRDFAHPIYERSTMLRHSSPTTRSGRSRPTYQDVLPTIRINERESRANTGKHHSRNRPDPSATLRLRSRSREHRTKQRNQRGLFGRENGVEIRAKARPTTPAAGSGTPQSEPEPPQTFDEPLEMVIPASVDIPPSDWSQLSPELQEQGQEEGEPTPGNRTMGPDRPTMVQKAYEDRSRTKAACELVQAGIMSLAQRVRTEKYETFLHILHSRNPSTPQMILGNMASIFAYSGKMTRTQAAGSYTFKVSDTVGFGLLAPTLFRHKPGFQEDTSNLYYIIHGTTSKGASRILAEELIWRFPDAPRSAPEWLSCLWTLLSRTKSWRSYSITI